MGIFFNKIACVVWIVFVFATCNCYWFLRVQMVEKKMQQIQKKLEPEVKIFKSVIV